MYCSSKATVGSEEDDDDRLSRTFIFIITRRTLYAGRSLLRAHCVREKEHGNNTRQGNVN